MADHRAAADRAGSARAEHGTCSGWQSFDPSKYDPNSDTTSSNFSEAQNALRSILELIPETSNDDLESIIYTSLILPHLNSETDDGKIENIHDLINLLKTIAIEKKSTDQEQPDSRLLLLEKIVSNVFETIKDLMKNGHSNLILPAFSHEEIVPLLKNLNKSTSASNTDITSTQSPVVMPSTTTSSSTNNTSTSNNSSPTNTPTVPLQTNTLAPVGDSSSLSLTPSSSSTTPADPANPAAPANNVDPNPDNDQTTAQTNPPRTYTERGALVRGVLGILQFIGSIFLAILSIPVGIGTAVYNRIADKPAQYSVWATATNLFKSSVHNWFGGKQEIQLDEVSESAPAKTQGKGTPTSTPSTTAPNPTGGTPPVAAVDASTNSAASTSTTSTT